MAAAASSSQRRYDVFLSFRGEDTRNNFTAHLDKELRTQGINSFIDEEKLERGKAISAALVAAIENSKFSIIVLSQNYASSRWCLEELVKILECKESRGQMVVPIFYNVDPSDVRNHRGNFGEALAKHEDNFKENMERVQIWRDALTQVSSLSGWDSRNKNESLLIEEIVKDILNKSLSTSIGDTKNLVGIDARIQEMEMQLCLESNNVRMVGIWGVDGIGKTTLAKAIYEKISSQFEACSFFENLGEDLAKNDLNILQQKFLSQLLEEENLSMKELTCIKARLSKKFLIVLDNVNDPIILDFLIENLDWFGRGSRIIITTRDKSLLISHGVNCYEAMEFDYDEALEFLAQYSLKHELPRKDFKELSGAIIWYAQGLPLALKVLGSFLFGMSREEWRNQLNKVKSTPINKIQDVLKISYDALDDKEKSIFLDIACFFKGEDKDYVMEILDNCDFFSISGIQALINKSLVTISMNRLMMHDLIQDMGMEIARQESPIDHGRCSRLWLYEDIYDILKKKKGNEKIEGIFLDLSYSQDIINFTTKAFARMNKLRFLKVYKSSDISRTFGDISNKDNCKVHCSPNFKFCYEELRYLYWYGCSLKSLPNGFNAKNLVHLSMQCSHIQRLWKGIKVLEKLKVMDFSHSKHLIETPNFSRVTNLERLVLEECVCLCKVHSSLGDLKNLTYLSLKNCKMLKKLPSSLCDLKSLETFILSGCSKIEEFPENFGNLEMLKDLNADGTALRVLPSSFSLLRNLDILSFLGCKGTPPSTPWWLPRSSSSPSFILHDDHLPGLSSLRKLNLSYHNLSDETNLSSLGLLSSLEVLDLSGNNFVTLPSNISGLSNLESLGLEKCRRLQVLPELPSSIFSLIAQDCTSLKDASNQVLKSLLPTTKLPKKTFKRNSGAHLIYVVIYGSRIPDWIRYQRSGCQVEAELPPNWFNSNLLGFTLSFVSYVCESDIPLAVSYSLCYSTFSDITNFITISSDKEGVGLDHMWLLYVPLPLFSNWHNGTRINWHEVTHIRVSFGTHPIGQYDAPIKRCGFDLVYSKEDVDVNHNST